MGLGPVRAATRCGGGHVGIVRFATITVGWRRWRPDLFIDPVAAGTGS
ncbi:hypothetical protein TOK_0787 [Pseudonocardia sp. N23]|nr:hypothetical protein TOK_0787 [Pseudonocardia sp. N23]